MTLRNPLAEPGNRWRSSVAVRALVHEHYGPAVDFIGPYDPPSVPTPNYRLTNLCESSRHGACHDALRPYLDLAGNYRCSCLCHNYRTLGGAAMLDPQLETVTGYRNPDGSQVGSWDEARTAGLDETELRYLAGDR